MQLKVIITGRVTDDFLGKCRDILMEMGVGFTRCDDIYMAAAEVAVTDKKKLLVLGRLEQLSKESCRFLQKAAEKRLQCCCFTEEADMDDRKVRAVEQYGAIVVNDIDGVKKLITELSTTGGLLPPQNEKTGKASHFNKDSFLATRAELDALLR